MTAQGKKLGADFLDANPMNKPRRLHQFPLSVYCEKARWLLDYKQLPYACVDYVPSLHLIPARLMAGISTLPVLQDPQGTVGDSTAIALWLERHYPEPALLPADTVARAEVLRLEEMFDEIGDHVRRCVWSLAIDRPDIDHIFFGFEGYAGIGRWVGSRTRPVLRQMLIRRFHLQPERVRDSWARVGATLDWMDRRPGAFLVGPAFTLADLTAATMLAPLFGPQGSPWSQERLGFAEVAPERAAALARPVAAWVQRMYAEYRQAGVVGAARYEGVA